MNVSEKSDYSIPQKEALAAPIHANPKLDYKIHADSEANASILEGAQKVSKTTGRVKLAGNDLRFAVNALEINKDSSCLNPLKAIQTLHAKCWFVKVSDLDGREVWLNTSSLAKRILCSKDELTRLSGENKLTSAWIERRIGLIQQGEVSGTEEAAKMIQVHAQSKEKMITNERIQEIAKHVWVRQTIGDIELSGSGKIFALNNELYKARFKDGTMHIYRVDLHSELGEGSYGTVVKALDVANAQFKAFKIIKKEYQHRLPKMIKTLDAANPENKFDGVALKPEIDFNDGYVTKIYESDLNELLKKYEFPIQERIHFCLQLAHGKKIMTFCCCVILFFIFIKLCSNNSFVILLRCVILCFRVARSNSPFNRMCSIQIRYS